MNNRHWTATRHGEPPAVTEGGEDNMPKMENESGQSVLVITLSILAILALIALVVDVGNAYAHRRKVQNAVDAAALAGARKLAFRDTLEPPQKVLVAQVYQEIGDYAEANGVSRDDVAAVFIKANGEWVAEIDNSPVPVPKQAEGVSVVGDLPFNTYFAHMLGFPIMQATADAQAYVQFGPCSSDGCLFPLVVSYDIFADDPRHEPVEDKVYTLWVHDDLLTPGNFGWAYWVDGEGTLRGEPPQGPEVTSLEPNLLEPCRSGAWDAGEWVHGDNGVNFQPVLDLLEDYVLASPPISVTIPIYDEAQYEGTNSIFRIVGFGAFELLCAHSSRAHYVEVEIEGSPYGYCGPDANTDNTKYLTGKFVRWFESAGFEDGCIDTGISGVSFRPPKSGWMPEWLEDD